MFYASLYHLFVLLLFSYIVDLLFAIYQIIRKLSTDKKKFADYSQIIRESVSQCSQALWPSNCSNEVFKKVNTNIHTRRGYDT